MTSLWANPVVEKLVAQRFYLFFYVGALREAPVLPLNQSLIVRFTNRPYKRTPA